MMRTIAMASALLFGLAACGNDGAPDGRTAQAGEGSAECAGFYSPVPGLKLDFPFHFRSDRIYTKKGGEVRRGVMLEYLGGGDNAGVYESLSRSLAAIGYTPKSAAAAPSADATGDIRQPFVKAGADELFVGVSPNPGRVLSNPDAKGTVWISWQLQPGR